MRFRTAVAAAAMVLFARPLLAQTPDASSERGATSERNAVVAQSLFERGRELMSQGAYAQACPLLAESQKLDPGGGTLLNLGICYERAGRLATAYATLSHAVSQANRDDNDERRAVAQERLDAIRPRLSQIVVIVDDSAKVPGLTVTIDDVPLGRPVWGTGTPADPGQHRILVEAPGHTPWQTKVGLSGDAHVVEVRVPVLQPGPGGAPMNNAVLVHINSNMLGLELVRVDSFSQRPIVCIAPCDQPVEPGGRLRFRQGSEWVGEEFTLYPGLTEVDLRADLVQEKRTELLVLGIIGAGAGGVAIFAGAIVAVVGALDPFGDGASPTVLIPIGIGAAAVGTGIALIAISGADHELEYPPVPSAPTVSSLPPALGLGLSTTF